MFGILESAAKAAAVIVDVPVAIAADLCTGGGDITGRRKSYTASAVDRFETNIDDIIDP